MVKWYSYEKDAIYMRNDSERTRAIMLSQIARKYITNDNRINNDTLSRIEKRFESCNKAVEITEYIEENPCMESWWFWMNELHKDWYAFRKRSFGFIQNQHRNSILRQCDMNVHMTDEAFINEDDENRAILDKHIDYNKINPDYTGWFAISIDYDYKYCINDANRRARIALIIIKELTALNVINCVDSITVGSLEMRRNQNGGFSEYDSEKNMIYYNDDIGFIGFKNSIHVNGDDSGVCYVDAVSNDNQKII